ncbi:MAG: YncE family protein [Thermoplasmata archaeon]
MVLLVGSAFVIVLQTQPKPCSTCNLGEIDAGYGPVDMVYDNATGLIFVLDSGPAAPGSAAWGVTVINGTSETVAKFIHTNGRPGYSFAYDPQNENLYATSECDDGIYVMNAATGLNVTWVNTPATPLCEGPQTIAYDPVTGYVVALDPPNVIVINPNNETVVRSVNLGVASFPLGINSVTGQVYVATSVQEMFSFNLTVLNGSNFAVESSIQLIGSPQAVSFDPLSDRIDLVASVEGYGLGNLYNGTLYLLTANGRSTLGQVRVGELPYATAVDKSNRNLYVTNTYSDNISVVNESTSRAIATVAVGPDPWSIVYDGENACLYTLFYGGISDGYGPSKNGYLAVIAPPGSHCAVPPYSGIPSWTDPTVLLGLAVVLALFLIWRGRRTKSQGERGHFGLPVIIDLDQSPRPPGEL